MQRPVPHRRPRPRPPPLQPRRKKNLLKNAEPESEDRVIGEEDAVAKPKAAQAKASVAKEQPPTQAVSVRIVSSPEGAVVSLGKRVFGRAPLNLRFRPGITYELAFVKKGYQSTSKRFAVRSRPNQTVKVYLAKKPAPRKSLLRRIFGR